MVKLSAFVAILAFHAVFARSHLDQQQSSYAVQDILSHIQQISREIYNSHRYNGNVVSYQGAHGQVNEFVHHLHQVVYRLQHVINHNHEVEDVPLLRHIVEGLNEVVHSVQQISYVHPRLVHQQLTSHVEQVVELAQNLSQVIHQVHSEHVSEELRENLDDLLVAIHHLQVYNRLHHWSYEQIKNQLQNVDSEVSRVVEHVQADDDDIIHEIVHHARHYGHLIGEIVHDIEHEVHDLDEDKVNEVVQNVVEELRKIQGSLQKVGHHWPHRHHSDGHKDHEHRSIQHPKNLHRVEVHREDISANREDEHRQSDSASQHLVELKSILQKGVHGVVVEVLHLLELVHGDGHVAVHGLEDLVQDIVAQAWVAIRGLERHIAVYSRHGQNY